MTSHVNLEATGFVVHLVTAWVGTWELACFSEVSPIVREEGTEGDEGFLTAWELTLVGPLWRKVDPLVIGEARGAAELVVAHLADKRVVLLVHFDVSLQVVDRGEPAAAAFKLAAMRPLLIVGLKVALQFVGGGEGPAAAFHLALIGPRFSGVV